MKYWLDTEFIAHPFTIDLVSIGLVAENGREFYAESSEVDWSKANPWTLENVRPQLDGKGMSREYISYALRNFTDGDEHPVFWGYFPAYDWVALRRAFRRPRGAAVPLSPALPRHQAMGDRAWRSRASAPEGKPPPRARRRPLDERGLGVPREPPSPRRAPAPNWTQEPRPVCRSNASPFPLPEKGRG